MTDEKISTDFAPAERASEDMIQHEADLLLAIPLLGQLLDSIPDIVLILNEQRQIVFANQALADVLDLPDRQEIYGLRPGEVLNCIHSDETLGGCGTTSFCKNCGAVNSILAGLRGKKTIEECRISQKKSGNAFDLRVAATPFETAHFSYVICVITDISHEKRKHVLERIFFHDISNTLTSIICCADLLPFSSLSKQRDIFEKLAVSARRLQEEVNAQKALIAAESGDLPVYPVSVGSLSFLHEMLKSHNCNVASDSPRIDLDTTSIDTLFLSDKILLSRVFGNMLKNALEASEPGKNVLAGCRLKNEKYICFWVQNAQFMPPDIQLQIFNRSFSTKGPGRGIGTYSMKLLTERYLKGKVAFATTLDQGTIFSVTLPLILE